VFRSSSSGRAKKSSPRRPGASLYCRHALTAPHRLTAAVAAASARAQTAPVFQIFSARLDGADARSLSRADARVAFRGPGGHLFFVHAGGDGTAAFVYTLLSV
jgi:hypothetical protein